MGGYVHKPVRWNREAKALWTAGQRDAAVKSCLEALTPVSSNNKGRSVRAALFVCRPRGCG